MKNTWNWEKGMLGEHGEIGRDKWLNVTIFHCMNKRNSQKNLMNTKKPMLNLWSPLDWGKSLINSLNAIKEIIHKFNCEASCIYEKWNFILATIQYNKLELTLKSSCLGKYLLSLICNELETENKIKDFMWKNTHTSWQRKYQWL